MWHCTEWFASSRRNGLVLEPGDAQAGLGTRRPGDFTAGFRLLWIAALALIIGAICAFVAVVLLGLIHLFTNLFYFQDLSLVPRRPADSSLGALIIAVPVVGGLIIGLMARFGSERIRGHGIPEALEAILIGRSRMSPKVAVLKPLSSAISIGSGGPFGAEGPIIMTGGAFGSIIAQVFHLTAAERKTLLVAGAAGGMTATFGTPAAAVLLAIELLLFEFKPRSLFPVILSCTVAAAVRPLLLEPGAFIPHYVPHPEFLPWSTLASAAVIGICGGFCALLLTLAVYTSEDLFHRLKRLHWMWWPALGGLAIGLGGAFQPRALGIGKDVIDDLLYARFTGQLLSVLLPLLIVKCLIWAISLGSGTSGGVLAPLLMIGGGVGALVGCCLPAGDERLWPLVGMAAVMGGTMRAPLTGTLFALELTQDIKALPALLVASAVAYGFTVLVMKRSILTEKVARRGYHISREYTVDPLELVPVREVMSSGVVTIPAATPVRKVLDDYFLGGKAAHQAYPVVDGGGKLVGVITRRNLLEDWVSVKLIKAGIEAPGSDVIIAFDLIHSPPISILPWESCRAAAERMAEFGVGRLPVVSPEVPGTVVGMVTRSDLLKPRARSVEEELKRERYIHLGAAPQA